MLKNISIQKRSLVKTDKHPTHDLVAYDENYENRTIVGSLWTKVAQDNDGKDYKFLSGSLQKERVVEGKKYEGYVLLTETEYNNLLKNSPKVEMGEALLDEIPFP